MSVLIPSATVVLLREKDNQLEVLLLKRNSKIAYGGMWVFPGGKIDPEDYRGDSTPLPTEPFAPSMMEAARHAAERETQEEAGIAIPPEQLLFLSHWTTPEIRPKRFSTWFFIAPTTSSDVQIDGGEIHEHCWRNPADAMNAHKEGEIELAPPTYLTLRSLAEFSTVEDAVVYAKGQEPQVFVPRVELLENGLCYFYHGDAGYEQADHLIDGAKHRLYALKGRQWRYELS